MNGAEVKYILFSILSSFKLGGFFFQSFVFPNLCILQSGFHVNINVIDHSWLTGLYLKKLIFK